MNGKNAFVIGLVIGVLCTLVTRFCHNEESKNLEYGNERGEIERLRVMIDGYESQIQTLVEDYEAGASRCSVAKKHKSVKKASVLEPQIMVVYASHCNRKAESKPSLITSLELDAAPASRSSRLRIEPPLSVATNGLRYQSMHADVSVGRRLTLSAEASSATSRDTQFSSHSLGLGYDLLGQISEISGISSGVGGSLGNVTLNSVTRGGASKTYLAPFVYLRIEGRKVHMDASLAKSVGGTQTLTQSEAAVGYKIYKTQNYDVSLGLSLTDRTFTKEGSIAGALQAFGLFVGLSL